MAELPETLGQYLRSRAAGSVLDDPFWSAKKSESDVYQVPMTVRVT